MAKGKWELVADIIYQHFGLEEDFSRDEIEGVIEANGLSNGKIHSRTWKALFDHQVLAESMNKNEYFLLPKPITVRKSSGTFSNGLKIHRAHNQYYAQYIEEAVVAIINSSPIVNNTKFVFQQWELDIMNEDACNIASYLSASSATYVGRKTSTFSCDLIADGKEVELKYS